MEAEAEEALSEEASVIAVDGSVEVAMRAHTCMSIKHQPGHVAAVDQDATTTPASGTFCRPSRPTQHLLMRIPQLLLLPSTVCDACMTGVWASPRPRKVGRCYLLTGDLACNNRWVKPSLHPLLHGV